jgi:hypothetical protein
MADKNITWVKTGDDTWQAEAYRAVTYTAVITKTGNDHSVVVNPGAVALGVFPTLRNAKNSFRKYLFDK